MRRGVSLLAVAALISIGAASTVRAAASASPAARLGPGVAETARVRDVIDVVVTLDRPASLTTRRGLASVATWSWAFPNLPAAGLRVRSAALDALRRVEGVRAVYLNERLQYDLAESAKLNNAAKAWVDLGVSGKDVTIAILDSGVDFSHPDLAPAKKANIKLLEFGSPTPVVPVDAGDNSDTSSGHGTHVAGDAAGRGTQSGGALRGMAWEASLVGLGAGEGINIFTALEGFDYILGHPELGVRIINNSWGSEFAPYDPANPINVATKALADKGVVVLFAMGNSYDELTMNPYANVPWVIPVAAGTKAGSVTDFSSGGIDADVLGTVFDDAHVVGDPRVPSRLGLYHPSVTATGENVVSTRAANTILPIAGAPADVMLSPEQIPYYTTMSGTSMATPETSGIVALMLEANSALTPPQVRSILEITANPIAGLPFWVQGYGHVDAFAAVSLAKSLVGQAAAAVDASLAPKHADRDTTILAASSHPTHTYANSDHVGPPPFDVVREVNVPSDTVRLKVNTSGPSTTQVNVVDYTITVTDASGAQVASGNDDSFLSNINLFSGASSLDIDLEDPERSTVPYDQLAWGTWKVTISSTTAPAAPPPVSDLPVVGDFVADALHSVIALFSAPPLSCAPVPTFEATGSQSYRLQDDGDGFGPYPLDTSYTFIGPVRNGSLGNRPPRKIAAQWDVVTSAAVLPVPMWQTDALSEPLVVGGAAVVTTYATGLNDGGPEGGVIRGALVDIAPDGSPKVIATMPDAVAHVAPDAPAKTVITIPIADAYTLPAGHRLAVTVSDQIIGSVGNVLFYDSAEHPSGLLVETGRVVARSRCVSAASAAAAGNTQRAAAPAPAPAPPPGGELPATGATPSLAPALAALALAAVLSVRRRLTAAGEAKSAVTSG